MTQFIDNLTVEKALSYLSEVVVPATQATAVGTLTLTVASNKSQYFTGTTAGQIVQLPDATTLQNGQRYEFFNQSNQSITVNDGSGTLLFTLSQTSIAYVTLQTNGNAAGGWIAWQVFISSQASGILNYQVVASTTFSSSSTTDVVITGFTVTPQAGTYAIWYNAAQQTTASGSTITSSIYRGGSQIVDSQRDSHVAAANANVVMSTMTVAAYTGAQACDIRVRTSSASQTVGSRTLTLIRLGS